MTLNEDDQADLDLLEIGEEFSSCVARYYFPAELRALQRAHRWGWIALVDVRNVPARGARRFFMRTLEGVRRMQILRAMAAQPPIYNPGDTYVEA